jgi:hypothetical protein
MSRLVAAMTRTSTWMVLLPAQPLEGLVLEHPQQLGLQPEGKLAELVQEERSAVRLLEAAVAGFIGAGEGAPLVAEQFAL